MTVIALRFFIINEISLIIKEGRCFRSSLFYFTSLRSVTPLTLTRHFCFREYLAKGVNAALSQGRSVLQQEIARDRNLLFADEVIR